MENSWTVGTMYNQGTFNGVRGFFTQPDGQYGQVYPQLPQGAPFTDYPGAGVLVFSYGPWIGIGCGHLIHEFNVIQDVDYTQDPPALVSLLTCPVCSYIQRAMTGSSLYGPTAAYDPLIAAVIVA